MNFDLVIRGDLVLPEEVLADGYVAIADGRIGALGAGTPPLARETIDARGQLVFPGLVDGQVHAGSAEGFTGIEDLTRSAAAGGVTTIVDMPYDEPDPVVDEELLARKIEVLEAKAHVDVALYGTVAKRVDPAMIHRLAEAGVAAFKISTYESHPKRFPRISHPEMARAFAAIAETGLTIAVHNEDQELVDDAIARAKAAGRLGAEAHSDARPALAERVANAVLLEIGAATGARVHIVHSSIARGFDQARSYRAQGFAATAETCIHYLILTEADVVRAGARGKVNPPIRAAEREAIWQRLMAGDVAFVSSDHCSWPLARKDDANIFASPASAPGVAVLLPLFFTAAVENRGLGPEVAARMLAEAPARHFGLYPRKGALRIGADADIAIAARCRWQIDEARQHCQRAPWSPYHGLPVALRIAATFLRGRKIFDGDQVLAKPGQGMFLRPVGAASFPRQPMALRAGAQR
jgi:allantoinase